MEIISDIPIQFIDFDMQNSHIILPPPEQETGDLRSAKLRKAYQSERKMLEIIEVELNRSRIYMLDIDGNIKRVPLISEH
ncbi:hypothetical protein SAMN04488136_1063 [Vibrio xiamenensis]|uniref:Uncharacterized protein n=2 Tax=Vibrio xiamenensis TaxID=861298 RepID=A0A1G7YQU9_9VIBR|nr:hypothetical protein SAMN04488136_1063 [Vibrio xiamenensis]